MDIICNECGFRYSASSSYCPECGHPTSRNTSNGVHYTNCPNCGAPITNALECEYCGTVHPRIANNQTQGYNSNDAMNVGIAAFVGGVVGGILGSD